MVMDGSMWLWMVYVVAHGMFCGWYLMRCIKGELYESFKELHLVIFYGSKGYEIGSEFIRMVVDRVDDEMLMHVWVVCILSM